MSSPLINLEKYNIILASNSPRRKELLKGLGIIFEQSTSLEIDESYPNEMPADNVAEYLALKKAEAYKSTLKKNTLIITADTVVINDGNILGKPENTAEAKNMIQDLSGKTHKVITGVCLSSLTKQIAFSSISEVTFSHLTKQEIDFYVSNFRPFDKAGAYGIQEWIGYVGVEGIVGSFYNVMGLPVQKLYQELKKF